jgi:hypothetical protein
MKFCPVVPEICHGQVHASRKERIRIIIIKNKKIKINIIIRNGAKTISLQTLFGRLNKNNSQSHIFGGSKGVGVTIESYEKLEISYINVDNF